MDVNAERALLIKELQQVEDISLLHAIKAVLHYEDEIRILRLKHVKQDPKEY